MNNVPGSSGPDEPDDADFLDELTQQVRQQHTPPLPDALQGWSPAANVARPGRKVIRWSLIAALTASVCFSVGFAWWRFQRSEPSESVVKEDRHTGAMDVQPVNVAVMSVDTQRFDAMENGLEDIDRELVALRRQAQLLDARRQADALLGTLTQHDDAKKSFMKETPYEVLSAN